MQTIKDVLMILAMIGLFIIFMHSTFMWLTE
jgi:hypothetical protein